jgi:DNA-binding SARP family transcriptional activator/tetratricopeptide (TPR) repeat protein
VLPRAQDPSPDTAGPNDTGPHDTGPHDTGPDTGPNGTGPSVKADPRLTISLLGDLVIRLDGQVLDVGGRRQRAVFAILVVARGDVVSAERLIDSVWGEQAPTNAIGTLQAYVSHLRRQLEPGREARSRGNVIVSKGAGYALEVDDDAVDGWHFDRLVRSAGRHGATHAAAVLTEALELWRGPALVEYATQAWAQPEVVRLTELRQLAREQLVSVRLDLGEAARMVPESEALVAEEPLREERWRLLVLALYRAGRQGDALAALRRARRVLADELGVDPGPALRALETEVLTQSPALEATDQPATGLSRRAVALEAPPRPAAPLEAAGQRRGPTADNLVERDRELDELRASIADVQSTTARLVLVEGPAGIGKSRLLSEARRLVAEANVAADVLTLTARGSQLEREYAFGVVRQLFEPVLVDPGQRADGLAGAAQPATAIFDVESSGAHEPGDRTFSVLHGLYWLTLNLSADRPVFLIVDDLQWCDPGSLRYLAYLLRRLDGLPVMVVASLRTGESYDEPALLAEIEHDPATVVILPGPLTNAGVASLVRQRLGHAADDAFIAACHRTTTGNPLLLRQLLRALESDGVRPDASHADTVTAIGSRAISSMVLMRLARLPASASTVALAIAVLGDGSTLPTISALAGLPETETAAAISVLARTEVVSNEHPLGFVHPLVRDAIYRSLSAGQRELEHGRAAKVLEARGASPEQIAAHLLQIPSRADAWVVRVLRQAAATAIERGAAEGAAAYLARALAEPPHENERFDVLVELGQVAASNDGPAALRHLSEAYEIATDPVRRAGVARLLAQSLLFAGPPGEATVFAQRARAELPDHLVDERQAMLALARTSGYMHGLDPRVWRGEEVGEILGTGAGARMLAADVSWELLLGGSDRDRCITMARFALERGELQRVDPGLFWIIAAFVLDLADDDLGTFWDDALVQAYGRGSLFSVLAVHLWRGRQLWHTGDLREAALSLFIATELSEDWGSARVGMAYGEAFLICVLVERGDTAGARAMLDRVRPRLRIGDSARLFDQAESRVLLAEGRFEETLDCLRRLDTFADLIRNPVWLQVRTLRAAALAGLGCRDEAIALIEEELAAVHRWGAPSQVGAVYRHLGQLRCEAGDRGGLADLRTAVDILATTRARLEHARALYALAVAGPSAEAGPLLRRAWELAGSCGAEGLSQAIADQIARAGLIAPIEPEPSAALSTSERQIVTMFVAGSGAREIAQKLFITPRSVQMMLDALGERVGVRSPDPEQLGTALRALVR